MAVKLLTMKDGYTAGTIVTHLTTAQEVALIASGDATATLTGAWNYADYVSVETDATLTATTRALALRADAATVNHGLISPALLGKWRVAKARVRANVGDATVAIVGDSTTVGQGSGTGASNLTGARSLCPPSRLADQLELMGLPSARDNVIGNQVVDSTSRVVSAYTAYNSAVSVSVSGTSDWYIENLITAGGYMWRNDSGTGAFSFTPQEAFNEIDVWYVRNSGNASFTVDIGGAVLATTVTNGTPSAVLKATISTGGGAAAGTVTIKRTGTGTLRIVGFQTRNTALRKVNILNLGAAGWDSIDWNDAAGFYSPLPVLTALAPDLAIINVGLNDLALSTPLATYLVNMQAVITAAKAGGGSVILCTPPPQDTATRDPLGNTEDVNREIRGLATLNSCGFIDLHGRFTNYATGSALGVYSDAVHMTATGYADIADIYARALFNA